ncbi:MAG: FtsQ-type POTRA domain-containing protein [Clostridia bacterium]|nr:FtsQ-type POTRA domain-containing protein [Clostridia bacterium]
MERNQNNRRLNSSRKVSTNITEYGRMSQAPVRRHKRTAGEMEEKIRYQQQQKQKRLAMQRRRALIILILCIVTVVVLMFMTPIFNIKSISVNGNSVVTLEEIDGKIGDIVGENLFRTGAGTIQKRLKTIPYIDEVTVTKRLIPPTLKVSVTECQPAAYIGINSQTTVIDSSLKVLGDSSVFDAGSLPNVIGVEITGGDLGSFLTGDNAEKLEILKICLETMEETGVINKVRDLDITDTTSIKFVYDDRLDVLCGTQLDLQRKLRLFKETISNNNLTENAKGIIDLSVTGKAVYTP